MHISGTADADGAESVEGDHLMHSGGGGARAVLAAVCAALVALPFLVVQFPPVTDLPQQVAQIRLFLEALGNPASPYRIQWFTPYSLSYGVLGAAWALFSPANVGRAALLAIGMLWIGATHLLAARRGRPPEAAILASLLFFNSSVYWGFLSFAIGWPVFVLWFLLTARDVEPFRWREAVLLFGGALLLYVSHALWFAVGVGWLVLSGVALRRSLRTTLLRLASISPLLVAAAIWYPHLSASGFASPTVWTSTPIGHLSFSWLVNAAFGGLRGATEYVTFGILIGWLVLALRDNRAALAERLDKELLLAGTLFFALAVLLPYKYMNTIQFAERWLPAALTMFLLAVPAPTFRPALLRVASLAVLAVFCLSTAAAWMRFQSVDLAGLSETLAAVPPAPRVIGLDFLKESPAIKERPFLQVFAYAQVMRGGTLNFSFADFAPSLVVFKERRRPAWTSGLEWDAERVQSSDFAYFDYAIVAGDDRAQAAIGALPALTPLTRDGVWRLYRVERTIR